MGEDSEEVMISKVRLWDAGAGGGVATMGANGRRRSVSSEDQNKPSVFTPHDEPEDGLMDRRTLEAIVLAALEKLRQRDKFLLDNRVAEWAIAHRFAVYLEEQLSVTLGSDHGWNVDCEYNQQGTDGGQKEVSRDGNVGYARPDVAVHRRGACRVADNLLSIEMKKSGDTSDDFRKLRSYTSPDTGSFQYLFGLSIVVEAESQVMQWFRGGQTLSGAQ